MSLSIILTSFLFSSNFEPRYSYYLGRRIWPKGTWKNLHLWEPPHRVAWLGETLFLFREIVKTILFLCDCVNRNTCVMRVNVTKCAWFREIIQKHAWFHEKHLFLPISAFLRENPNFSLIVWMLENAKKVAWLSDWGPPPWGSLLWVSGDVNCLKLTQSTNRNKCEWFNACLIAEIAM